MKIAFDFNGVIDAFPQEILTFVTVLRKSGHKVGVCTGNIKGAFEKQFERLFDFMIYYDKDDSIRLTGRECNSHVNRMKYWKSAVLKEHKVDIIFDDSSELIQGTPAIQIGTTDWKE